jgi:hypothetical protein
MEAEHLLHLKLRDQIRFNGASRLQHTSVRMRAAMPAKRGLPAARLLFDSQNLIRLRAGNILDRAAGPFDPDLPDRRVVPQTEEDAAVVGRQVTRRRAHQSALPPAVLPRQDNLRPDAVTIRSNPAQLHRNPMIRLAAVVAQQSRRATVESELRAAVAPAAATASERTINIFRAP